MKAQVRGEIGSRRAARENAVELAYEREVRGLSVADLLAGRVLPPDELTARILTDEETHRAAAEALIATAADNWDLHRMPVMDLTLLRLAVAEMLTEQTPPGVVIAETVYLTGLFSTEESSRFVNGVLGTIQRKLIDSVGEDAEGAADEATTETPSTANETVKAVPKIGPPRNMGGPPKPPERSKDRRFRSSR